MIRVLGSGHYPDDFIRLSEIKNLRFHHVNYREYLSVWGDWIIGVYPFAVNITSIYKRDGSLIGYDDFPYSLGKVQYHHNNFVNGDIDYDPCLIYEEVSGFRIHHYQSDDCLMGLDHSDSIRLFESDIISQLRDKSLGLLGV